MRIAVESLSNVRHDRNRCALKLIPQAKIFDKITFSCQCINLFG